MTARVRDGVRGRDKTLARLAGIFYLLFIGASILADALGGIGLGTAEDIARAIIETSFRYRLALVVFQASALLFLASAWCLYAVLGKFDRDLALAFLLLNAVGVAVQCAATIPLIAAMRLGHDAALIAIETHKTGFVSAQLFFGTWLFPLGYLVLKSRLIPRAIGILLLLDGVGVLIWFSQGFLLPDARAIIYPGMAVSFAAEFSLGLWLAAKGIKPRESGGDGE